MEGWGYLQTLLGETGWLPIHRRALIPGWSWFLHVSHGVSMGASGDLKIRNIASWSSADKSGREDLRYHPASQNISYQ